MSIIASFLVLFVMLAIGFLFNPLPNVSLTLLLSLSQSFSLLFFSSPLHLLPLMYDIIDINILSLFSQAVVAVIVVMALKGLFLQLRDVRRYYYLHWPDMVRLIASA